MLITCEIPLPFPWPPACCWCFRSSGCWSLLWLPWWWQYLWSSPLGFCAASSFNFCPKALNCFIEVFFLWTSWFFWTVILNIYITVGFVSRETFVISLGLIIFRFCVCIITILHVFLHLVLILLLSLVIPLINYQIFYVDSVTTVRGQSWIISYFF